MSKNAKKEKKGKAAPRSGAMYAGMVYMLLMLGVFPLFYRNNYIDIMESKWLFFMSVTLLAAAVILLMGVYRLVRTGEKPQLKSLKVTVHEGFLLFFIAAILLSWRNAAQVGYPLEAWDGSLGKLAGVFMYLVLMVAYLVVSRWGSFDTLVVQVFLWANFIVFSLVMLNHFMVDPLGMYKNLDPTQYWMFCSTMGNINVLSGYFAVFIPVMVCLFMNAKSLDGCALYATIMCAGFMAVIAANGDAAIIGVLAGFAVLLWYAFEDQTKLRRYLIASALFFTCALIVGNMDQSFADSVKEPLDTFPSLVATSLMSKIAALLLWCLVIIFMSIKKKDVDEGLLKKLRNLIFGAAAIAALTALSVFIWFSFFDRDRDLGVWDTYLRFSDLWGSSRGFTWKRTFILFRDHFDLLQKLFGFGPDLLIVPYHTFFHEEIFEKMGAYLADAHSEFFQILGSMGLAGTVAYFGFQISSAVRIARHRSSSPLMPGVMASIAGYMVQGMFCSPQTFSTPALFIMIGVGEMLVRRSKEMDSQ